MIPDLEFDIDDFERDLKIDENVLSEHLAEHGSRYWKYGKLYPVAVRRAAEAKAQLDHQEQQLKVTLAGVCEATRKAHGDKITEAKIKNLAMASDAYKQALDKVQSVRRLLIKAEEVKDFFVLVERIFRMQSDELICLAYSRKRADQSEDLQVRRSMDVKKLEDRVKRKYRSGDLS